MDAARMCRPPPSVETDSTCRNLLAAPSAPHATAAVAALAATAQVRRHAATHRGGCRYPVSAQLISGTRGELAALVAGMSRSAS
jgi:hypothetical protein